MVTDHSGSLCLIEINLWAIFSHIASGGKDNSNSPSGISEALQEQRPHEDHHEERMMLHGLGNLHEQQKPEDNSEEIGQSHGSVISGHLLVKEEGRGTAGHF